MRKLSLYFTLFVGLLLTGCASVPMATDQEDAAAKQFTAPTGKANIYVYRNETMGAAVKMPVLLDGKNVGDTAAKTYLLMTVEPGMYEVTSKAETDDTVKVNAEANQNYYVWQEIKMGMWSAGTKLHLVDAEKGKEGVRECKLIKTKL